jgi:DNA-binding XRE family transcriptional regulator
MSVQIINQNGQPEWAVLPYEEYLQLVEQAEMLQDIQDFDTLGEAVRNGTEELLPAAVVFALASEGNPLKVWREYRGFTQQQLAEKVGISVPFLSQIETGKRKASIGVLINFASILQVDVDDLILK